MAPPALGYVVDPADPRAPSEETWAGMSPEERARVVAMLPAEVPLEEFAPEGDPHRTAKSRAIDALDTFFRKMGRRVYLSSELAVFYPNEPRFAPDLLAVVDVEPRERMKWVVSDEGKGLDLVIEVHVAGDRAKDHEENVARYARLGIPEYFIFDRGRLALRGFRLARGQRVYRPILPQGGRWASEVLGLDLMLEGSRLRFYAGNAPLLESNEILGRLSSRMDELIQQHVDAEALATEAQKRAEDAERRADEEKHRADELSARLAEALAELSRLRGGG